LPPTPPPVPPPPPLVDATSKSSSESTGAARDVGGAARGGAGETRSSRPANPSSDDEDAAGSVGARFERTRGVAPVAGAGSGESRDASLGVVGDGDDCPEPPADASPNRSPRRSFELPPAGESSPAEERCADEPPAATTLELGPESPPSPKTAPSNGSSPLTGPGPPPPPLRKSFEVAEGLDTIGAPLRAADEPGPVVEGTPSPPRRSLTSPRAPKGFDADPEGVAREPPAGEEERWATAGEEKKSLAGGAPGVAIGIALEAPGRASLRGCAKRVGRVESAPGARWIGVVWFGGSGSAGPPGAIDARARGDGSTHVAVLICPSPKISSRSEPPAPPPATRGEPAALPPLSPKMSSSSPDGPVGPEVGGTRVEPPRGDEP